MSKPRKKSKKILFILEIVVLLLFIGGLFVYGQIDVFALRLVKNLTYESVGVEFNPFGHYDFRAANFGCHFGFLLVFFNCDFVAGFGLVGGAGADADAAIKAASKTDNTRFDVFFISSPFK